MATEQRFFETKQVEIASITKNQLIKDLRGGEIITIRALRENSGIIYVGDENVSTSNGFPLNPGDAIEIKFQPDIPSDYFLRIHAIAATADDDIAYIFVPYSFVVEKIKK